MGTSRVFDRTLRTPIWRRFEALERFLGVTHGVAPQGRAGLASAAESEVQELELESLFGSAFVYDTIKRVPRGEFGGHVLHRVVMNQTGRGVWHDPLGIEAHEDLERLSARQAPPGRHEMKRRHSGCPNDSHVVVSLGQQNPARF